MLDADMTPPTPDATPRAATSTTACFCTPIPLLRFTGVLACASLLGRVRFVSAAGSTTPHHLQFTAFWLVLMRRTRYPPFDAVVIYA